MDQARHAAPVDPEPKVRAFYVDALRILDRAKMPYVVGGGYAMAHYTGIARNTKDLDLFIRPADRDPVLATFREAGYHTEFFYPFWISKALDGDAFIDILYNSGNGLCPVDDEWFTYSEPAEVHGYPTRFCPAEEQLWSKAFVQDRDRFDGADIAHLILCRGERFDWERLIRRFKGHERVLLAHLHLFSYSYPSQRDRVPGWVMDRLNEIIDAEPPCSQRICFGTNVSQKGFTTDVKEWGYRDGRLKPFGRLSQEEIDQLPS